MKKTVVALTIILILLFASFTAAGGYMVYKSSTNNEHSADSSQNADLKLNINEEEVSLEITNGIPGIIIFSFGAIGLILMLFRIPTHEVLGYRTKGGGNGGMCLMFEEKIVSSRTIQAPLPVWWLLKRTRRLEKIEHSA
jgi:TRAP-type C4-dicarboxylate transport system permease small subunit